MRAFAVKPGRTSNPKGPIMVNDVHKTTAEGLEVFPVLLAGGSGTRLWPVSRTQAPKQLAAFGGRLSLLQETIQRLSPALDPDKVIIVCGEDHRLDSDDHLASLGIAPQNKIIGEPLGRNTAPAILLAVLKILAINNLSDALFFIFPADHVIQDVNQFHNRIAQAIQLAMEGNLVTFGIQPAYPETGYGYIEGSIPVSNGGLKIKRFVEKPDLKTAKSYIDAGNFFWNSGMFAFSGSAIIKEFQTHQPEMFAQMKAILEIGGPISKEAYERLENLAFDVAIMEKTSNGVVLPSEFGWSDIGSWKSLHEYLPKDENGNALIGDVLCQNTYNSLLFSKNRLVASNDLSNIVLVETPDAVFVSNLESSRDVKEIVTRLKQQDRPEHRTHLIEKHPWGTIKYLEESTKETVVRITIKSGECYTCDPVPMGRVYINILAGDCLIGHTLADKHLKTGESLTLYIQSAYLIKNNSDLEALLIITHQKEI
jgi:mannose-1-phosphate guanylyltransferase/mannose-6-phosphate isomerase